MHVGDKKLIVKTGSAWGRQEVHGEDWMYMRGQEIHEGDKKCMGETGGA